ncbi:MAG: LemA family protein [bacterium]|nr:LemA family protein [bacterium]
MNFFKRPKYCLLFSFILLLMLQGCGINNIPSYQEATQAAFSQILNQYQRRADLIPNLVNTVKGYAAHEKDTFVAVTNARRQVTEMKVSGDIVNDPKQLAQFEKNQQQLTQALSKLMVVVERYPELKANENFLALQSQLEGTENRIAVARRDYIVSVQKYNTELRTFPGRIWAATLYREAKPLANFTAPESVTIAPKVEF